MFWTDTLKYVVSRGVCASELVWNATWHVHVRRWLLDSDSELGDSSWRWSVHVLGDQRRRRSSSPLLRRRSRSVRLATPAALAPFKSLAGNGLATRSCISMNWSLRPAGAPSDTEKIDQPNKIRWWTVTVNKFNESTSFQSVCDRLLYSLQRVWSVKFRNSEWHLRVVANKNRLHMDYTFDSESSTFDICGSVS